MFGGQLSSRGVTDPAEILYRFNDRPLTCEIELLDTKGTGQPLRINRWIASCERGKPDHWKGAAFIQHHPVKIENAKQPKQFQIENELGLCDYSDMAEALKELAAAMYVPPYRNAINQGGGAYYDLSVGSDFIQTWHTWHTGGSKQAYDSVAQIIDDIRRIFGFKSLAVTASKERHTLVVSVDGKSFDLHELGAGIAQFIIVFGNVAMKAPSFVLIDEPELNLHPALQLDFVTSLASYVKRGLVFATHSVGLARSVASRIYSVRKDRQFATVSLLEKTSNYVQLLGELSYSTFKEVGYDKILLVEGVHDVTAVQQLMRQYGTAHKVVIVPLGGTEMICGDREPHLAEVARLAKDIAVLIDSERSAAGEPLSKNREAFVAACDGLNMTVCVTERRAIENYFSDAAVKSALGKQFEALAPYVRLSESATPWNKQDNWRIAQKMDVASLDATDVGRFLSAL